MNKKFDLGSWIWIAIWLSAFPPLGIYLLFRELMGYRKTALPPKRHPNDEQRAGEYHYTAQELHDRHPAKVQKRSPAQLNLNSGRLMTWIGGGVAALFGVAGVSTLLEYLSWGGLGYAWSELLWLFSFSAAGGVVAYAGLTRTRKGRRFQRYLSLVGKQTQVSVAALAQAMGCSVRKTMDELEEMLERGLFKVGYLDHGRGVLMLTDEGVREEEKPQPEPEHAQEDAVLGEIRKVNDAIADEGMSAKIDRIGAITARILDYQRKNPGRDSELRSFLDYYLPTTLKILRSYAELEAQGIRGENIQAAKEKIEGMMDKVVEGFEKQLDRLFHAESLDISSDVQVLEQMLKKDGLSGESGTLRL